MFGQIIAALLLLALIIVVVYFARSPKKKSGLGSARDRGGRGDDGPGDDIDPGGVK